MALVIILCFSRNLIWSCGVCVCVCVYSVCVCVGMWSVWGCVCVQCMCGNVECVGVDIV